MLIFKFPYYYNFLLLLTLYSGIVIMVNKNVKSKKSFLSFHLVQNKIGWLQKFQTKMIYHEINYRTLSF